MSEQAKRIKFINPFQDTAPFVSAPSPENTRYGSQYLNNLKEISVGDTNKVFRFDQQGLWLGAAQFEDAPFKVDMEGNLTASSVVLSGYLQVGEAAGDVNDGATKVAASKIGTGTFSESIYVGAGVGSAYILLDAANNRILMHDGTNPRFVIEL